MEDTRARWDRAYVESLDFDTWGQVEEAIEGYQRLQVAAAAEYVENVLQLPPIRREGIGKLASVLKTRVQELQTGNERGIGLVGMKSLRAFMKDMIVTDVIFPLVGIKTDPMVNTAPVTASMADQGRDGSFDEVEVLGEGTLRGPPVNVKAGDETLTIFIEKWGFKDASEFYEPRVVVSVRNERGDVIEAVQESPIARNISHNYVHFENTVHIQTPVNRLPKNAAIFLEFRHFKVKKNKKSCKAYCFLEIDELRSGPVTCEVYKKPANYARNRKPALLSIKPFYLHLELAIEVQNGAV